MNEIEQREFERLWSIVEGMAFNYAWPEGGCLVSPLDCEIAIMGKGRFADVGDHLKEQLFRAGFIQPYPAFAHGGGWLVTVYVSRRELDAEAVAVVRAILRQNGFGLVTEQEANP